MSDEGLTPEERMAMNSRMPRRPEPEVMDILAEAKAYAETDFSEVNQSFAGR